MIYYIHEVGTLLNSGLGWQDLDVEILSSVSITLTYF